MIKKVRKWDLQTVATVIAAIIAFINLFIDLVIANYVFIILVSILLLMVSIQVILNAIKRGQIEHLLVEVRITKWKQERIDSVPYEKSKPLPALGRNVTRDIFDESIVINDWILSKPFSRPINISHITSGTMILKPITPADLTCEVGPYLKIHKKKGSNTIKTNINTSNQNHIRYLVKRYNAFQDDNQDFMVPSTSDQKLNQINLSIDFEEILPNSVFEQLPNSRIIDNESRNELEVIMTKSSSGLRWNASIKQKSKNESILMQWKLVSGFPNHPVYIFGYGSLLNPNSIRESIPDYDSIKNPLIPAYLENYTRDFSAITRNVNNLRPHNNDIPEFITYMNISHLPGNKAFGVLMKGNNEILTTLDKRESFYIRIDVTKNIRLHADLVNLPKDAVVFTYICIQPLVWDDYDKKTSFGSDYESLIIKAQELLDKQYKTNIFSDDWNRIIHKYSHWQRLISSNTRTGKKYS